MQSNYDTYETGGSSTSTDNSPELIVTTYSTFEGTLSATFGTSSQYGQSLGIAFEDVEIIDGCLYADTDKQKFKLFSWQDANDMSPQERLERGQEPSAGDADEFIRKKYAGTAKEYELVAARVPEITDEDGEVLVEASSRSRSIEFTDDGADFGEWNDLEGMTVPFDDAIMWYSGTEENGPTISSKILAETLTEYGEDAINDEDSIYDWLADDTGQNVLRDELRGRRVKFFVVTQQGDQYTYNKPVVLDVDTDAQINPNNRQSDDEEGGGAAGGSSQSESRPEPVADFLQSGQRLELNEERAHKLLEDLIEDPDNAMTREMVDDEGGADELVEQVV